MKVFFRVMSACMFVALTACSQQAAIKATGAGPAMNESEAANTDAPSLEQRIYFFQHKMMPRWTYESEGNFYRDLVNGFNQQFYQLAEESVSAEFSAGIEIRPLPEKHAVLVTFPEPKQAPDCFYVLIVKQDQGFSYYTYERTMDLPGLSSAGVAGVVGFWDTEGGHGNMGARGYTDADSFIEDMLPVAP